VLEGASERNQSYLFVNTSVLGSFALRDDFAHDGLKLLSLTSQVAFELHKNVMSADNLRSNLRTIEDIKKGSNVLLDMYLSR